MDSRKFKKVNNNKQHKRRRKRKTKYNKKYIIYLIIIIILFVLIIGFIGFNKNIPDDTHLIQPEIFDFTPYGYSWNTDLYGYCNATDEYGYTHSYYFNLEQMAALYKASDGTFNFTDGIYVTLNNSSNTNIVTNIYKKNGAEIIKPYDYNEYEFAENARFLGMNQTYCARGFGFTADEYEDSSY